MNYTDYVDEVRKMLKAVINGQSSLKQELLKAISKNTEEIKINRNEIRSSEKRLSGRIDRIGKQVAYLEDDAPTRDEHDKLENRIEKVEQKMVSI